MIKYIILLCSVLVIFTNVQAQQLMFRRIPGSYETMRAGYWVSINDRPLMYDSGNRTFLSWSDSTGQWSEVDRLSDPFEFGEVLSTTEDGSYVRFSYSDKADSYDSLVYIKRDGSKFAIRPVALTLAPFTAAYAFADGSLYVGGIGASKQCFLSARYENGKWRWLDSIPIKDAVSCRFFRDPTGSVLYVTISQYYNNSNWRQTFRLTKNSTWTKHNAVIEYVAPGVQLGSTLFVPYKSKLCRTDSLFSFFAPLDTIPASGVFKLNDSTMYIWYWEYDRVGARIYYTTDGGSTFRRHPASKKFWPLEGIKTCFSANDGTIYLSSGALSYEIQEQYRIRDTTVVRIPPPNVETTRKHPAIRVVRQATGLFITVPPDPSTPYDSCLFDLTTGKWRSLSNSEGMHLRITQAFTSPTHTVVATESSGLYVLQGSDLRVIKVETPLSDRGFVWLSACMFRGNNNAVVIITDGDGGGTHTLLDIDLTSGVAKELTSDWSLAKKDCLRRVRWGCSVGPDSETLVAATSGYWRAAGDSLFEVCDRNGVLISTDNGVSWTNHNEGFGMSNFCWDVQSHKNTLYAIMSYGMWSNDFKTRELLYRRDPGKAWQEMAVLPIELRRPMKMSVQPSGNVYFCHSPIFRSTDKGETLELLSTNFPEGTDFTDVAEIGNQIVASNGRYVWVADNPLTVVNESTTPTQPLVRWDGNNFIVRDTNESNTSVMPVYAWDIRGDRIPLQEVSVGIYKPLYDLSKGLYMLQIGERYYRGMVY